MTTCREFQKGIAMSAYDEGVQASKDNKSSSTCPYGESDPRRNEWMAGWKRQATNNKPIGTDS